MPSAETGRQCGADLSNYDWSQTRPSEVSRPYCTCCTAGYYLNRSRFTVNQNHAVTGDVGVHTVSALTIPRIGVVVPPDSYIVVVPTTKASLTYGEKCRTCKASVCEVMRQRTGVVKNGLVCHILASSRGLPPPAVMQFLCCKYSWPHFYFLSARRQV